MPPTRLLRLVSMTHKPRIRKQRHRRHKKLLKHPTPQKTAPADMKGEGTFVRGSINHFQEIFTRNVGLFLEILRMTVQHAPNHTRREKHVGSKRISALLVLDRSRRFTTKPKINAHAIPTTMMGIIMKPNRSVSSTSSIHPPPVVELLRMLIQTETPTRSREDPTNYHPYL